MALPFISFNKGSVAQFAITQHNFNYIRVLYKESLYGDAGMSAP